MKRLDRVWDHVRDRVHNPVFSRALNHIQVRVWNLDSVWDHIRNRVRNRVQHQGRVWYRVWDRVWEVQG